MKKILLLILLLVSVTAAGTLTACSPRDLAAPTGLAYEDEVLTWQAVPNASRYKVEIDGVVVAEVMNNYYVYATDAQTVFRVAAMSDSNRYRTSAFSEQLVYKPIADTRGILNSPTIYEINGDGLVGWSYVSGATGYRILVNGNVVATVGTVTQYRLTGLADGTISVQVQAVGGEDFRDSPRSAIYRLEVNNGRISPPKLLAPAVTFDATLRRLVWNTVSRASGYAVYQNEQLVQQIDAADASHRFADGNVNRYYYAPTINVRNTQIYVVALADGTVYADSTRSNVISFPLHDEGVPANLRVEVIDGEPTLTWDALTNCSGYRVKVEQNNTTIVNDLVSANMVHLSLADGNYAVSVAGEGDGRVFDGTEFCAQIGITCLGGHLQPLDLATPQSPYLYRKTLYFTAVPNASTYHVLITTPYDDELGDYDYYTDAPSFALPVQLYKTVVYMYVRAIGAGGYTTGLWSAGVVYYPRNDDPEVVDNNDDDMDDEEEALIISGNTDEGDTPHEPLPPKFPDYSVLNVPGGLRVDKNTLYWSESLGADNYELVVDGAVIPLSDNYYILTDIINAHVCKVRAVSMTADLLNSPFSAEIRYERTHIATPTGLTLQRHVLTWDSVKGAEGYSLQVDGEIYALTGNSVDLETLLPYDGTYRVRVSAHSPYEWQLDGFYSQTLTYVADYEQFGTEHKPYAIATVADLALMQTYPTAYFALDGDIDVGEIAPMFTLQNSFAGVLDGRGHTLDNILLDGTDSAINGFFGCMYGATIRNVTFRFASVVMNPSVKQGVLAGEVVQCTFRQVEVQAVAVATSTFGTFGTSTGSTFDRCRLQIEYTQAEPTAALGGLVGDSRQDAFADCTVDGSLTGGIYMGALAATASDSGVIGCAVGNATAHFLYTASAAYVGAVGKGTLTACDLQTVADFTLSGNCFAGGFGGKLICNALSGSAQVKHQVAAATLYVGGVVGFGSVDTASVSVDFALYGNVDTLYAGGALGYAQGLTVCTDDTAVVLAVDLAVADGRYLGGIVGYGPATYTGAVQGNIIIGNTVSVGRVSGISPTPSAEGWFVADKE